MNHSRRIALPLRAFWRLKAAVEQIPGAHRLYKMATSLSGEGRIYEINGGPLHGARWKRFNQLPYWYHRGIYEPEVSARLVNELHEGDVFWDLGAHAGYHALVAARIVGPNGHVLVVEPEPVHTAILREEMALNAVSHYTLVEAAVSNREGDATFRRDTKDSRVSALAEVWTEGDSITVRTVTLGTLSRHTTAPAVLKMDIEGAEGAVLAESADFFAGTHRPRLILLATHGRDTHDCCFSALRDYGYTLDSAREGEFGTIVAS
jgi:FkbM family methyltransferase